MFLIFNFNFDWFLLCFIFLCLSKLLSDTKLSLHSSQGTLTVLWTTVIWHFRALGLIISPHSTQGDSVFSSCGFFRCFSSLCLLKQTLGHWAHLHRLPLWNCSSWLSRFLRDPKFSLQHIYCVSLKWNDRWCLVKRKGWGNCLGQIWHWKYLDLWYCSLCHKRYLYAVNFLLQRLHLKPSLACLSCMWCIKSIFLEIFCSHFSQFHLDCSEKDKKS